MSYSIRRCSRLGISILLLTVCSAWCFPDPSKSESQSPAAHSSVKGKVTYGGEPPAREDLKPEIERHADAKHLLTGDTRDQKWLVNPEKGVKNVVVWLRPLRGASFPIPPGDRKWTEDPIAIRAPSTMFEPRVLAFFPSYWDADLGKQQPTGQQLKLFNEAPFNRNPRWGGNPAFNSGQNLNVKPYADMNIAAKPAMETRSGEDLIIITCG